MNLISPHYFVDFFAVWPIAAAILGFVNEKPYFAFYSMTLAFVWIIRGMLP